MSKFPGCTPLDGNFTSVPNVVLEHLDLITSMGEMKVIMYIMRHTFGFRKGRTGFQHERKLTLDEFMHGRKLRDRTRMDGGTGLSKPTVLNGLKRAIAHGFITVEIDNSDGGRVKKFYSPVMQDETVSGAVAPNDKKSEETFTPHSTNIDTPSDKPLHPTEKETEKETKRKKFSDRRSEQLSPTQPPPPESPIPIQEAVSVAPETKGSLTTRIRNMSNCPGYDSVSGACNPAKCDSGCYVEPMLEAQFLPGDTHEGMVDKSGVPVSDATRAALRDVMKAPVGLDAEPFTNLIATLDSALASDDVSDRVKGIFREARDKLADDSCWGCKISPCDPDKPDCGYQEAPASLIHQVAAAIKSNLDDAGIDVPVFVPGPAESLPSVYTASPEPGPPDDSPKCEVPYQSLPARVGKAMVSNIDSGTAVPAQILPDSKKVVTLPPTPAPSSGLSYAHERVQQELSLLERKKANIEQLSKKQISTLAFNLEAYFCEIAGLKTPNRSTAYFAKKAHVRWGNPCKEMMRLADYDLTKAKRFMDAAWAEVVKDNWQGKISTAQSIENYFGAQARGKGKAVAMPGSSGVLGLTETQKKTGLFSRQRRNGAK